MNSRIPFVTAVVGALLIGGATTGGTFASWKESAPITGNSSANGTKVTSGTLDFGRAPTSDSMTVTVGSSAVERIVTVTDSSAGKNLARRISASLNTNAALTAGLFTVGAGGACTNTAWSTPFTGSLGGQFKVCVRVQANSVPATNPATLTLSLAAQQTGVATGWSITKTVPITVTVNSAFTLGCNGSPSNNVVRLVWNSAGAGTITYTYGYSTSASGPYTTDSGSTTSLQRDETWTSGPSRYYRVSANTSPAKVTNVLKITRNSARDYTCEMVTP